MKPKYPRGPTHDEFRAIYLLEADNRYPDNGRCVQERHELSHMLDEASDTGKFIITEAMSDSPGFIGQLAFIIWPDTSITFARRYTGKFAKDHAIARRSSLDSLTSGNWYLCDKDGVPWL